MGLTVPPDIYVEPQHSISYKKRQDTISVSAPSVDDAKTLFEWAAQKVGLIPTP